MIRISFYHIIQKYHPVIVTPSLSAQILTEVVHVCVRMWTSECAQRKSYIFIGCQRDIQTTRDCYGVCVCVSTLNNAIIQSIVLQPRQMLTQKYYTTATASKQVKNKLNKITGFSVFPMPFVGQQTRNENQPTNLRSNSLLGKFCMQTGKDNSIPTYRKHSHVHWLK